MKKRSILGVIVFPFLTLGIYSLYWLVSTKKELNRKGAEIPTAWLIIIPIVNIYWIWKYYEGASKVTEDKVNGVLMFVIHLLITGIISAAICQDAYNNLAETTGNEDVSEVNQSPTVETPQLNSQSVDERQSQTFSDDIQSNVSNKGINSPIGPKV
jgi:hypothetical protein